MLFTSFHRQFANYLQGVRVLTTFQPVPFLCDDFDVAGQEDLTPFSTRQLMAYEIKF